MTWERFGFICRKSTMDSLQDDQNSSACQWYGKDFDRQSWPKKLLDDIAALNNKTQAQQALQIYSELNLANRLEEPMQFKRVFAYLCYIIFVFFMVVSIYQLKVTPAFMEAFNNFDISLPKRIVWFQQYWWAFVIAVSALMGVALLIGLKIKSLFQFKLKAENSLVFKLFMFKKIRQSYSNIITLLTFPLKRHESQTHNENALNAHLHWVASSDLNLSTEIQALLDIEIRNLIHQCEKQMKGLSIAVAAIVIAAVFVFLNSAYSPLFMMGETL